MDTPNKLTDTRLTVAKKTDGTNKDKKQNQQNQQKTKPTNKQKQQPIVHSYLFY